LFPIGVFEERHQRLLGTITSGDAQNRPMRDA
jgi:hypothetical protein